MIVAAAKRREHMADHAKRAPIKPDLGQCRPYQRADENQVAAALAAKQSYRAPNLSNRYPVVTKAFDAAGIARAFQREQHTIDAACFQAVGDRKRHRSTCRDQADRRCDLQRLVGHGRIINAGCRRRPEDTARGAWRHR